MKRNSVCLVCVSIAVGFLAGTVLRAHLDADEVELAKLYPAHVAHSALRDLRVLNLLGTRNTWMVTNLLELYIEDNKSTLLSLTNTTGLTDLQRDALQQVFKHQQSSGWRGLMKISPTEPPPSETTSSD